MPFSLSREVPSATESRTIRLAHSAQIACCGQSGIRLYNIFFGPALRYSVENQSLADLESEEFRRFLGTVTAAPIRPALLTRPWQRSRVLPG